MLDDDAEAPALARCVRERRRALARTMRLGLLFGLLGTLGLGLGLLGPWRTAGMAHAPCGLAAVVGALMVRRAGRRYDAALEATQLRARRIARRSGRPPPIDLPVSTQSRGAVLLTGALEILTVLNAAALAVSH